MSISSKPSFNSIRLKSTASQPLCTGLEFSAVAPNAADANNLKQIPISNVADRSIPIWTRNYRNATWVSTTYGDAIHSDYAATDTLSASLSSTTAFSLTYFGMRNTSTPDGSVGWTQSPSYFMQVGTADGSDLKCGIGVRADSSNHIGFDWWGGGAMSTTTPALDTLFVATAVHSTAGRFFYYNGSLAASATARTFLGASALRLFTFGAMLMGSVHSRALTGTEVATLHADPFALFEDVATTGGGTTYKRDALGRIIDPANALGGN